MRFREHVTETAGFYNTVGFNDDTRAFFSIPGRHDVARRMDCSYLAKLVRRAPAGRRRSFCSGPRFGLPARPPCVQVLMDGTLL